MTLIGLPLIALFGLLAASTVLVFLLYQLKDTRRGFIVASLEFYRIVFANSTREKRTRIRRLSLLLQLVIVSSLVVALGEPALEPPKGAAARVLVVFDTSASMLTFEQKKTRLELGKERLLRYLDTLPPKTLVSVAFLSNALSVDLPFTASQEAQRNSISRLSAAPVPTKLQPALADLAELLRDAPNTEIVLVTDNQASAFADSSLPHPLLAHPRRVITVGKVNENLAIIRFVARRHSSSRRETELLLELGNFGRSPQTFDVEVTADGAPVYRKQWKLEANEQRHEVELVKVVSAARLHAQIQGSNSQANALHIDDDAYATLETAGKSHLTLVGHSDLYLEAALLSLPWLNFTAKEPAHASSQSPCDALLVNGGSLPDPLPCPTLWLGPGESSSYVKPGISLKDVGFDSWDSSHPMLFGLELYDIQVKKAFALQTGPRDHVLARSGTQPLLVLTERNTQPLLILGFAPRDSDFVLRPVWPLFVEQALTELLGPTHGTEPSPGEGGLLDATESRIQVREHPPTGFVRLEPERLAQAPKPWSLGLAFVMAAFALLLFEWFTFHRRITE